MSETSKRLSNRDSNQTLQASFNDVDKSITTTGFLTGKVGHKITQTISTTNVANDTATFEYLDDGNSLYSVKVIYTDGTRSDILSAERIT